MAEATTTNDGGFGGGTSGSSRGEQLKSRVQEVPTLVREKVEDLRDDVQDRVHDIKVSTSNSHPAREKRVTVKPFACGE